MDDQPPPLLRLSHSSIARTSLRVALIYLVVSVLWILFSDNLIEPLALDPRRLTLLQSIKGVLFVAATTVLLYFLVYRGYNRLEQSQRALQESRRELNTIVRNIPGMVYRLQGNPAMNLLYASEGALELCGYTPEQLTSGEGVSFLSLVHPDDRAFVQRSFQQAHDDPRPVHISYRIMRKDGEVRHVKDDSQIVPGREGLLPRCEGVLTDITEQEVTHRALRETEDRFRRIFEHSHDAICVVKDGWFRMVNPAFSRLFEYPAEEVCQPSFDFRRLLHEESSEYMVELQKTFRGGGAVPKNVSFKAVTQSGKRREIEASTAPIEWEGGRALLGFMRDVTDKLQVEARMIQSQRLESIGQLAAGVAHDFNNLLTSITGNTELAQFNLERGDSVARELEEIRKTAMRATGLTRQLLTFSRREGSEPNPLELNPILSDTGSLLKRLVGPLIEIKLDLEKNLWPVYADQVQFEQVVVNLAVNARDAMPKGGDITLRTRNVVFGKEQELPSLELNPGEYVLFEVQDTGSGMSDEVKQHIFEPFYTTKSKGKGTGFGLATVYGVVKQANGDILVDSTVGEGTTFRIFLPRHQGGVESREGVLSAPQALHGTEVILVVEDDPSVREMVVHSLRNFGYHVYAASDPLAAEQTLKDIFEEPDVAVMDVHMPEKNGPDFAVELQKKLPSLKVLLVSGDHEERDALAGKENIYTLDKPFGPAMLLKKVRTMLDGE